MLFKYKAIDADGRKITGRIEAVNVMDLELRLQRLDLDLVAGTPVRYRRLFASAKLPRRKLINFCFHLEQLARSGIPLLEGLADLRDSLEHPRFREIAAALIEGIQGGQTLSQAMEAHTRVFGRIFINLIHAGELSGRLPEVLASLGESLKWEDELAAHTRKILIYPAFVGGIVAAASLFMLVYMVPQLKQFAHTLGQSLPLYTRALFLLSDLVTSYWYLFLGVPVLAILAFHLTLVSNPLARQNFDRLKLKIPGLGGIFKKIMVSRLAGTFAMLYAAGIPILEAIRSSRDVVGNRAIRNALEEVEQAIREGRTVAQAFHGTGLFPPLVVRMLRIGENTGNLDEALRNVSYFYNRDVKEAVERAQVLMEPALTLGLGILLGWIMLSVMGPIYDMVGRIGS